MRRLCWLALVVGCGPKNAAPVAAAGEKAWAGPCKVSYDDDGDTRVDREVHTRYDALGRPSSIEERDEKGELTGRFANAYDPAGHLTSERSFDGQGAMLTEWASIYDNAGRLLRRHVAKSSDGSDGLRTSYTYDADGRVIVEEIDVPGTGVTERRSTVYDAAGRRVTFAIHREGGVDEARTFAYDAQGREVERKIAKGGQASEVVKTSWDAGGHKVFEESLDGIGRLVNRVRYRYDARGHVVEEKWEDTGGTPIVTITSSWDDRGNLLRTTRDGDWGGDEPDGNFDERVDYDYACWVPGA